MVTTAVILAAGLGSRLKDKTKDIPKGFLDVDGMSLIERSIQKLIRNGIDKIYIGTGYLSEVYDSLAEEYSQIRCIKSHKYESTGSMFTLYNMRDDIGDDFLLLESDLLYEENAISSLLGDKRKDIILASDATNSHDEVFIEADADYNLVSMSKRVNGLGEISGELVGISRVSFERFSLLCDLFEKQSDSRIDYEYIMVASSKKKAFPVKRLAGLAWCEIDDENHLDRALNIVLPVIKARDERRN